MIPYQIAYRGVPLMMIPYQIAYRGVPLMTVLYKIAYRGVPLIMILFQIAYREVPNYPFAFAEKYTRYIYSVFFEQYFCGLNYLPRKRYKKTQTQFPD